MKDFTRKLKNFAGQEILDADTQTPAVFSVICINALMGNYPEDKDLTGIQKLTRYKLAERIFTTPEIIELIEDEKKLINELVAKQYTIVVVGQVNSFLEE